MKHRAFTLIEAIVTIAIIVILAAILFPVFTSTGHYPNRRSGCRSNLKQIGLGFQQYVQDTNDHLPAVAASGGWGQAIQPYVKSWQIFHCPSATGRSDEQTTDYYMNARLSSVKLEKIESTSLTIFAGEGLAGQPANYSQMQLPDAWRADENSPAYRHLDLANYLFADGHVESLAPQKVTLDKPSANNPTFLLGKSQ